MNRQQLNDQYATIAMDASATLERITSELAAIGGGVPIEEAIQALVNITGAQIALVQRVIEMQMALTQFVIDPEPG